MTEEEVKTPEETLVDRADKDVERMEKAVSEMRELVGKYESMAVRNKLGGNSEAGQQRPEEKEETPLEYRKRVVGY